MVLYCSRISPLLSPAAEDELITLSARAITAHRLLWIDSRAGLTVGAFVLLLSPWLPTLYGMPRGLVLAMSAANLAYGIFSGALLRMPERPRALIVTLVTANAAWALACFVTASLLAGSATILGLGTLLFEGVFVGGLAAIEWQVLLPRKS